jgi:hypothetical protein
VGKPLGLVSFGTAGLPRFAGRRPDRANGAMIEPQSENADPKC